MLNLATECKGENENQFIKTLSLLVLEIGCILLIWQIKEFIERTSPKDIYVWISVGTRIIDNWCSVDIDLGFGILVLRI